VNYSAFCSCRRNDAGFQEAAVSRPPNETTAVWKAPLLVIFAFVVRNLRWLARVPLFPQIFDAALLISTALFSPSRLHAISAVEKEAGQLPDVNLGVHRFGGIGFFFRGKETSHIHGNGLLDCFVGREKRDCLLRERTGVTAHHVFPKSGWISFFVRRPEDVERALELIQIACAHREQAE
jgi:Luciferase